MKHIYPLLSVILFKCTVFDRFLFGNIMNDKRKGSTGWIVIQLVTVAVLMDRMKRSVSNLISPATSRIKGKKLCSKEERREEKHNEVGIFYCICQVWWQLPTWEVEVISLLQLQLPQEVDGWLWLHGSPRYCDFLLSSPPPLSLIWRLLKLSNIQPISLRLLDV